MQSYLRYVRNASSKFRFLSGGRGSVNGTAGAPPPAQIASGSSLGKSVPVTPPQQMNSFRSVFEPLSAPGHPAAHLHKRRYKLRWDWHLRNFLVSMIPPAALAIFALVYNSFHEDELDQLRVARDVEKKRVAEERDTSVEGLSARVYGDLHALRAELEAMRSEVALMRERDREKRDETGKVETASENAKARGKPEGGAGSATTSSSSKQVAGIREPKMPTVAKDPKK